MIERMDLLRALAAQRTEEIVVMTVTTTLKWPLVSKHELDFDFLAFGMGHAGDFGLGLALARPERKTIVLKGDGGLLENRSYEMVGAQPLPPRAEFTALARAAGFEGGGATGNGKVERITTIEAFEKALPRLLTEEGPHFVVLAVSNKEPLPLVSHTDHTGRIRKLRKGLGIE